MAPQPQLPVKESGTLRAYPSRDAPTLRPGNPDDRVDRSAVVSAPFRWRRFRGFHREPVSPKRRRSQVGRRRGDYVGTCGGPTAPHASLPRGATARRNLNRRRCRRCCLDGGGWCLAAHARMPAAEDGPGAARLRLQRQMEGSIGVEARRVRGGSVAGCWLPTSCEQWGTACGAVAPPPRTTVREGDRLGAGDHHLLAANAAAPWFGVRCA